MQLAHAEDRGPADPAENALPHSFEHPARTALPRGYAELEVGLHRHERQRYALTLRYSEPRGDAEVRPAARSLHTVEIDWEALGLLALDPTEYGRVLSGILFGSDEVKTFYRNATVAAHAQDLPLRVRLALTTDAPELQALRWETLLDPDTGLPLATNQRIVLSRYLSSTDWRSVSAQRKGDLRALAVIANPTDLHRYRPGGQALQPIDVALELERIRLALGEIPVTALASDGSASLRSIEEHLQKYRFDILYLVCHGALIDADAWLWLEAVDGSTSRVRGEDFVKALRELPHLPRFAVLASCQSAGEGEHTCPDVTQAMIAIGPRLAEAGIPAVIAMQARVSMRTVSEFMPTLFREAERDGVIDRAVAAARAAVRHRPDWWVPVLFMRLKSGALWYEHGFAGQQGGFAQWRSLLRNIGDGRCTPILGPGLVDSVLGSSRDLAERWADLYSFPLSQGRRGELPQVAQFLAYSEDRNLPRVEFADYLVRELRRRYEDQLPTDVVPARGARAKLDEWISAVGRWRAQRHRDCAHALLADLPFPIYVTTNRDNLLSDALTAAGKDPQVLVCRWSDEAEAEETVYDREPDYRPDVARPLVFHVFGNLRQPESLALTEDDYFDFLIGFTRNKSNKARLIPQDVLTAWTNSSLLFLGFGIDDWDFRTLFRCIVAQGGERRRSSFTNVAVQLTPSEDQIIEPEGARRYLETYFQKNSLSTYWGTADDFLQDLADKWKKTERESSVP